MGCASSSAAKCVPEETSRPRPRIFALVRLGHDVIRCDQNELMELVNQGDITAAYELWERHKKWIALHEIMEEGLDQGPDAPDTAGKGFFRLLDDLYGGVAFDAKLSQLHNQLNEKQDQLDTAFMDKDLVRITKAYNEYYELSLAHLAKEEQVMMPKLSKMTKEGHDVPSYMKNDILALIVDHPDFKYFIQHTNTVLEHGVGNGLPSVRIFDHALWTVATSAQWETWEQWIKEVLSAEAFRDVQDAISASGTPSACFDANVAKPSPPKPSKISKTKPTKSLETSVITASSSVVTASSTKHTSVPQIVSVRSGIF